MSTDTSLILHRQRHKPSTGLWVAGAAIGVALWFALYGQLAPFSDWIVSLLPLERGSHLEEAIKFFVFDTPKVLMLLTLVVFAMGVVRSFFSPERTRALLAGHREGLGNVAAAGLGIFTPFCSCSAVPLFVGFVSAGVPLGVTFSFLIAAPMINEVALGLLFAMLGWKVALTYLGFGLGVAIVAGWVIGQLHLEGWLESWVRDVRTGTVGLPADRMTVVDRIKAGIEAVRDIVGRVWMWIIAGIAVGAFIHGYVPSDLLASIMGKDAWWSVPARHSPRHPDVLERRRDHPGRRGPARQGRGPRHRARLHDVGDRAVAARDDHPAQGAEREADRRLRRRRRPGHPGRGLSVQPDLRLAKGTAMKDVKVLGPGCANCKNTAALIERVAQERSIAINLVKVEDLPEIMSYGVMSTPGVVVDGKLVHAGGVPSREKVEGWFA